MANPSHEQCPYCESFRLRELPRRERDHPSTKTWLHCESCKRIWAAEEQADAQPEVQEAQGPQ